MSKLLKIAHVADRLEVSPRQVRREIAAGRLATVRCGTSARADRVREQDLEAYIQAQRRQQCQSEKGVKRGTLTCRSTASAFEQLLASELRGKKQKRSKQKSAVIYELDSAKRASTR